MKTLIGEMDAVTPHGTPDHKTRMAALKEARAFIQSLLPKLSQADRESFSHVLTQEMVEKLQRTQADEIALNNNNNNNADTDTNTV